MKKRHLLGKLLAVSLCLTITAAIGQGLPSLHAEDKIGSDTTGTVNYFVSNGTGWEKVTTKETPMVKTKTTSTSDGREATTYAISSTELESVYGSYGFRAASFSVGSKMFGNNLDEQDKIYIDRPAISIKQDSDKVYAQFLEEHNGKKGNIYYIPQWNSIKDQNNFSMSDTSIAAANKPSASGTTVISDENVEVTKTANVTNWDERTYQINITAKGQATATTETERKDVADLVIVLDKSSSMYFHDGEVLGSFNECIDNNLLDRNKEYYFVPVAGNEAGKELVLKYSGNGTTGWSSYYREEDSRAGQFVGNTNKGSDIYHSGLVSVKESGQKYRYENIVEAVRTFVNELKEVSPESRIAITSFTHANSSSNLELSPLNVVGDPSFDGKFNDALNGYSAHIINNYGRSGTSPSLGINRAGEVLNGETLRNPNVIIFTDGYPVSTGTTWNTTESNNSISAAANLRNNYGVSTWAIGMKTGYYPTNDFMAQLAGDANRSQIVNKVSEVTAYLRSVLSQIIIKTETIDIENATVTDVVRDEFRLTDGEKQRLESEGAIVTENGNLTTVTWPNQTLTSTPKTYTINVIARDDFLGGNNIFTNVPGDSKVTALDKDYPLPEPSVNVKEKINIDLEDTERTIFLGENTPTDPSILAEMKSGNTSTYGIYPQNKFSEQVVSQWYRESLPSNSDADFYATTTWAGTIKRNGEVTGETTFDDIGNDTPRDTTKYYLKETYLVDFEAPTDLSNANTTLNGITYYCGGSDNGYVAAAEDIGSYTVYVIDGSITITKNIDSSKYSEKDGDPIFTYKIVQKDESGNTVRTFYKTLRFKEGENEQSTTIEHLEKGIYEVTELKTMRYNVRTSGVVDYTTSGGYRDTTPNDTVVEFSIGYYQLDGFTDAKDVATTPDTSDSVYNGARRRGHAIFSNDKSDKDVPTDTDTVKNALKIGDTMSSGYKDNGIKQDRADNGLKQSY